MVYRRGASALSTIILIAQSKRYHHRPLQPPWLRLLNQLSRDRSEPEKNSRETFPAPIRLESFQLSWNLSKRNGLRQICERRNVLPLRWNKIWNFSHDFLQFSLRVFFIFLDCSMKKKKFLDYTWNIDIFTRGIFVCNKCENGIVLEVYLFSFKAILVWIKRERFLYVQIIIIINCRNYIQNQRGNFILLIKKKSD